MSKNKTVEDRQQYVVKANDLIRKTRYNLTAQEQKIVLYVISKIKPNDTPQTVYRVSVEELCEACGLNIDDGGYYYKTIKEELKKLTKREWCTMPDKTEMTISWIGDVRITPLSGMMDITFNPNMAPYLFDLKERYTQYRLENVLAFKNKYAIRLYEILRSYTTQRAIEDGYTKTADISLDELRRIMDVGSYPRWADFDRFVLKKAVDEINRCSEEFHIEYHTAKEGRAITAINFVIEPATFKQIVAAHHEKLERLK